ncbi:MAG: hypothetical protein MUE65_05535 [Methanomassiliicoccales archaeon]|jgi:hypothetical protein|nr:hypothetical protein [Methanomassiliicoccales archaeon]
MSALCPNCKCEISGENIRKEKIEGFIGEKTWMYSCPGCRIVLGITKVTPY